MPISGGKYVAPTWVNDAPPALDAAELQAISDTIQKNEGDLTNLTPKVNGKTELMAGSYVGTGAGKVSIYFGRTPKIVFVYGKGYMNSIDSRGTMTFIVVSDSSYNTFNNIADINGNYIAYAESARMNWTYFEITPGYNRGSAMGLNKPGETYYYVGLV